PEAAAALIRAGADAGLPDAQAYYGQLLLDGQGVAADPAEAFRQFGLAAASGHVMAINMVGRCHEKGWGTPVDPVTSPGCWPTPATSPPPPTGCRPPRPAPPPPSAP
ncbi:tetratricopeptide repeat protein, partial [Sphingobium sp. IP1]|uniref:tetratricopeptide repeat protein n=1 Tax=Sphingobium sp. IP1 TaxID=2021637 RepID=UPI00359C3E4E